MYNGLEPYRCALKREPIIPQSSYLSGLLNAKETEVVKMGTTPPKPPPPLPEDYGKERYVMETFKKNNSRTHFRISKKNNRNQKKNK